MNNTIEKLQTRSSNEMSEVLVDLQNRGFSYLFKLQNDCISCKDYNIAFEEFDILEVHSMETLSATKNYILYAIKCNKYNIKGVLINQFSTYANEFSKICINKISGNNKIRINIMAEYDQVTL